MDLFMQIWEILINITEPLFLFLILQKKLVIREKALPFAVLGILVMAALTTFFNKVGLDYLPTVLITFAVYVCFASCIFKGTIWNKVMWCTFMILSILSANMITASVFFFSTGSIVTLSPTLLRLVSQVCYVSLNGFTTYLITRFNENDRYISGFIKISVVVLALVACTSLYLLMSHTETLAIHGLQTWIAIVLSFTILLLTLALLFFMDRISRTAKKMNDAQIELTKANYEKEYSTQVTAVIDKFREIKHDYVSHITAIAAHVRDEDWETLKEYVASLDSEYGVAKFFLNTGNKVFDSIVTSKALICSGKGIEFDISVMLPQSLPFSDMEFAALMGNLLDNAINAQEFVTDKKYVFLEAMRKGDMLAITVKNSSSGNYLYDNGKLVTTNADKVSHGLGLRRINSIVTSHGGSMNIYPEKDCFTATVLVPIGKNQEEENEYTNSDN